MTYKTTETKTVDVVIKPSDIYIDKDAVAQIVLAHDVVDFRLPSFNELFISAPGGNRVLSANDFILTQPRLIVKARSTIDSFWE